MDETETIEGAIRSALKRMIAKQALEIVEKHKKQMKEEMDEISFNDFEGVVVKLIGNLKFDREGGKLTMTILDKMGD